MEKEVGITKEGSREQWQLYPFLAVVGSPAALWGLQHMGRVLPFLGCQVGLGAGCD